MNDPVMETGRVEFSSAEVDPTDGWRGNHVRLVFSVQSPEL